jgi:hypothetical protein
MQMFFKKPVVRSRESWSSTPVTRSYLIAAFSRDGRRSLSCGGKYAEEVAWPVSSDLYALKESRLIQGARNVVGSYIAF